MMVSTTLPPQASLAEHPEADVDVLRTHDCQQNKTNDVLERTNLEG